MADGFIIKRGSQGGTKQVDSLDTNGLLFSFVKVLEDYKILDNLYSSIEVINNTKVGGIIYNES